MSCLEADAGSGVMRADQWLNRNSAPVSKTQTSCSAGVVGPVGALPEVGAQGANLVVIGRP